MSRSIAMLLALCAAAHADPLPNPDPSIYGEDPPAPPRAAPKSRAPELISTAVTAGLTAATLVSVVTLYAKVEFLSYADPPGTVYKEDAAGWRVATFAFGTAAVVSGIVTAYLWTRHRAPAFDVNASGTSAVVTYSGRF